MTVPGAWAAPLDAARPTGRAARLALVALVGALAVLANAPMCPFAAVTGHPCPGCGLTRATLSIVHGQFAQAFQLHPLSFVVSPLAAVGGVVNAVSYVRSGRWSAVEGLRGRWVTGGAVALGAIMIALWLARFLGAFGGPVAVG